MTEATAEKTARWEDYVDVFFSPRELYERRAGDRILPPLLALFAAGVLLYVIMLPVNRMMMEAAIADQPADAREAAERFGVVFQFIGAIMVPVVLFITVAFAGFLLWGVSSTFGVTLAFRDALLIATYAAFVYLIAQVLAGGIILVTGANTVDPVRDTSFGILRFVDTDAFDAVLIPVLRRFDLFAFWQAALWAIGVSVVARVSIGRAVLIAALAWILYAVPAVIWTALGIGATATATTA